MILFAPTGVLEQLRADWTSDRKSIEGGGFRVFQYSSSPSFARDFTKFRVVVRGPVDSRGAPRTTAGFYELILFSLYSFYSLADLILPSFLLFVVLHSPTRFSTNSSLLLCFDLKLVHSLLRIFSSIPQSFSRSMHRVIGTRIYINGVIGFMELIQMGVVRLHNDI